MMKMRGENEVILLCSIYWLETKSTLIEALENIPSLVTLPLFNYDKNFSRGCVSSLVNRCCELLL